MGSIGFLHISDLHQGMEPLRLAVAECPRNSSFWIWSDFISRAALGCSSLYGDLTQRGSAVEFERLEQTLDALAHLAALGHIQCCWRFREITHLARPGNPRLSRAARDLGNPTRSCARVSGKGCTGPGKTSSRWILVAPPSILMRSGQPEHGPGNTATAVKLPQWTLPGDFNHT